MKIFVSTILGWLCLGYPAGGVEPPIPLSLDQAKTGAYWEEGELYGHVRILSFAYGFEHVHHKLVIEWIAAPDSPDSEAKLVARKELTDFESIWAFGEAEFVQSEGPWQIHLSATNTYSPEETGEFVIKLIGVGKYELSQKKAAAQ